MSDVRSTTLDLADGLRGVPIPFAGKLSRLPSRALYCNGATPLRASYPELHEVMYIEDSTCDTNSTDTVTMDDTSEVSVGDAVEGPGIPSNTVVLSVDNATQITLDTPATATATNVTLRFYPWGNGDGSTTFDLPDLRGAFLRGAGSHGSQTKANGGAFAGPDLGKSVNDKMQQITGEFSRGPNNGSVRTGDSYTTGAFGLGASTTGVVDVVGAAGRRVAFNSANSTAQGGARTGDETHPFNVGVNYIIFY